MCLGSTFKLTFSRRQKFRLFHHRTLRQLQLSIKGHSPSMGTSPKVPKSSDILTLLPLCCYCQQYLFPPFFLAGSPKICLRTSHLLLLQFLFTPFIHYPNPAPLPIRLPCIAQFQNLPLALHNLHPWESWLYVTRKDLKRKHDYI